jgi:hypothetical protein
MKEYLFKYKVTVYQESDGDEHVYRGVVLANSFAQATTKVVNAFEFQGTYTSEYDCAICNVTIEEYLDEAGEHTDLYVFKEEEK